MTEELSKVNHPAHYNAGNIECIDAIEEAVKGLDGKEAFATGNAIKYLWKLDRLFISAKKDQCSLRN